MVTSAVNITEDIECINKYLDENYLTFFVRYDGNLDKELKNISYACAIQISLNNYILCVEKDNIVPFFNKYKDILNIEGNYPYTLSALQPVVAANITRFHSEDYLNLTGKGTVAAIIDTGIDYLNPQFWNSDNTSRIRLIWDQTIKSETPYNNRAFYGTVYNKEQIDKAIATSLSGGNPYDIVPSKDEIGHGTHMAGLVGAKGLNGVIGSAPECEFIIVKLKEEKNINLELIGIRNRKGIPIYGGLDIFNAINALSQYQDINNIPMSILISCGTSWTSHKGMSNLELFINYFSSRRGLIFVTNTGNQGDSQTHASGIIKNTNSVKNIEFNIGENEENFCALVWISKPSRMSIELISPSGEVAKPLKTISKTGDVEQIKLVQENSIISFNVNLTDTLTGDETIYITIQNPKSGVWQLRLTGDYIVNGDFNIWLPQRPLIQPETRFINADPYVTLLAPSLASKAITTSFYNQSNNTININSGRGYTENEITKPNLTTGGTEALTTGLSNQNVLITGGSVAGAVLCGATLLILQWGIVDGNFPAIYSTSIIVYLTRGTNKRPGDIYPNPQWGYGMLNLQGAFQNIRTLPTRNIPPIIPYNMKNYLPTNGFIKIPIELYSNLNDKEI